MATVSILDTVIDVTPNSMTVPYLFTCHGNPQTVEFLKSFLSTCTVTFIHVYPVR